VEWSDSRKLTSQDLYEILASPVQSPLRTFVVRLLARGLSKLEVIHDRDAPSLPLHAMIYYATNHEVNPDLCGLGSSIFYGLKRRMGEYSEAMSQIPFLGFRHTIDGGLSFFCRHIEVMDKIQRLSIVDEYKESINGALSVKDREKGFPPSCWQL
jgi:hypothetical protein